MGVTLANIFTDNMVLQQEKEVSVWGSAPAGSKVTVKFAGQEKAATADKDGRWLAKLDPLKASHEPRCLEATAGNSSAKISNILVGEVWLCSGQSNMQWTLCDTRDAEKEASAAQYPEIRHLAIPRVISDKPLSEIDKAAWTICTPDTAPGFSSVAYFFGREIHRKLGVPVGLINSSWGGTVAEAWTKRESLLSHPETRDLVEDFERNLPNLKEAQAKWKKDVAELEARIADCENQGFPKGWAGMEKPSGEWNDMDLPGTWQSRGLDWSGILWFRKEVEIPADWAGKELKLSIGATDKSDVTYFNGVQVGSVTMQQRPDAWSHLRTYDVPGKLVKAGKCVIAVRVHSEKFAAGMTGPASVMHLSCPTLNDNHRLPLGGIWKYAVEANYGKVLLPPSPMGTDCPNFPSALYNSMIHPFINLAIRGAIWYQGESNAGRSKQYQSLFPLMIQNWRKDFGQGDFPFYFVQLANYMARETEPTDTDWAKLREAQTMTLKEPNTGMAVAIDIGEADDIHPRNKQDVGLRLALNALHYTYGKREVVPCGPRYKDMKIEGPAIRISFDHVGEGLAAKGGALTGFAIVGTDNRYFWAKAHIEGGTVLVQAPEVTKPVAVRYAWGNNPECNLCNSAGLPASPFRTGSF